MPNACVYDAIIFEIVVRTWDDLRDSFAGASRPSLNRVASSVMNSLFETYLLSLAQTYRGGEGTEHSGRGALEVLLNAVAKAGDPQLKVQHEMGRQGDKGAPDFRVMKSGQIVGYVENKKIGEKLSVPPKSEQIPAQSREKV